MTMLKRSNPNTMNHLTVMAKTYKQDDGTERTEGETTDQSEGSFRSQCTSLSTWDAGVEIPAIENSFRKVRVSAAKETSERSERMVSPQPDALPLRSCLKKAGCKRPRTIQYTGEMKLRLPMCNSPMRKPSCITFNPSVLVRNVRSSHKLSPRQKETMWYQTDDYTRMEKKCQLIAKRVMRGESQGCRTLCTRGLENLINPSQRRDQKLEGWVSVLDEQGIQQSEGYFDEEEMRTVYQTASSEALREAQRRAMVDEQEVKKYLQTTRSVFLKLQS